MFLCFVLYHSAIYDNIIYRGSVLISLGGNNTYYFYDGVILILVQEGI